MILRFFKILGPIFILSTIFLSSPAGALSTFPTCSLNYTAEQVHDFVTSHTGQYIEGQTEYFVWSRDFQGYYALGGVQLQVHWTGSTGSVNDSDSTHVSAGIQNDSNSNFYRFDGSSFVTTTGYDSFGVGDVNCISYMYDEPANGNLYAGTAFTLNMVELGPEIQVLAPNFQYTISNKNIKATDLNQELPVIEVESGYYSNGYQVEWSLFKCTSYSNSTCIDSKLVNYQLLLQSQGYEYTTESYGDYELTAQYLVQQCYRYASYPATPDYCFMVDLGQVLESTHIVSPVIKHFVLAFMVTSTGDTSEESCYIDGTCVLPSELPCATDLPFFEKSNCIIGKQLKVGILNPTITALADMLKKVQVPADPTCGFNIPVATITDNNSIDLSGVITKACATSEDILESISIIMVVSNFGLSILLFNLTRRLVNKITSPDDHDIITGMEV
jgi:hypothetical protein